MNLIGYLLTPEGDAAVQQLAEAVEALALPLWLGGLALWLWGFAALIRVVARWTGRKDMDR